MIINITDYINYVIDGPAKSCQDILAAGYTESGVYPIFPVDIPEGLRIYCDMETDGGGWMVFQRRMDGSVDFRRNWQAYVEGFGQLEGEFWLGLDKLNRLFGNFVTELRVDLEDFENNKRFAKYE
ncbi:veficolin-1-like [Clavelina lepadiformis]|uniref:veficolin-1-like n=1 Tax=Clavelina lepadiformis TaxID=159417 RepID=UPI004041A238